MDVHDVAADLIAEQEALDAIVAPLDDADWAKPTPSPRWTVADQIGHLAFFDHTAALAIRDPDAFTAHLTEMLEAMAGESGDGDGDDGADDGGDAATLGEFRTMTPAELLEAWRTNRRELAEAAATLDDDTRVVWYGPSMGAKSFLTARLMEAWAHGQDIVDTVGGTRPATDRLRHIAQLGVITRRWTYLNRGLEVPEGEVRVELVSPSGETWAWGDPAAEATITGSAEDFCLVVTQRRHVDDTELVVTGDVARDWMVKAQAFAGPPTDGPATG